MMKQGSALNGLNVLDLGRMVAAPFCTSLLADMGADVIKVEMPGKGDLSRENFPKKDGVSTYFMTFNRSKRGVTLNLKTDEGKDILRKLVEHADVLVENFRPGVMNRLGLGYDDLAKVNPRLIYASISGFGQEGPYANRACFDPAAQAMSGMMSVTGPVGGPEVRCGASIADVMAGQNAAIAILAALEKRHETGRGQWIDVSLVDSCIAALASMNQIYLTTGRVPGTKGNAFEATAPGNTYTTKDGQIMLMAGQSREWPKLAKILGHPEWSEDARFVDVDARLKNRAELDRLLQREIERFTTEELLQMMLAVGLPAAPIMNIAQVAQDPQFAQERAMFVEVEHPQIGKMKITNQAIKMSETSPYVRACSPLLGEHNKQVYSGLGYSEEEIAALQEHGII